MKSHLCYQKQNTMKELKLEDLRVGDYVYRNGFPYKMTLQTFYDLVAFLRLQDFRPMPLTTKILERSGFYVDKVKAHIKYGELGTLFQLNIVNGEFEFTWGAVKVETVHHLQNLYRDLVKEELNIIF